MVDCERGIRYWISSYTHDLALNILQKSYISTQCINDIPDCFGNILKSKWKSHNLTGAPSSTIGAK